MLSQQQQVRASLPLQSSQYTVSYFVDLSHPYWGQMISHVLLILISLVARDNEQLLNYSLVIFISSIENSLLRCPVHFSLIGLFP